MIFEAAARHRNFTRAAQELHVSQAAVSKQIKGLERHLGVSLFVRKGRRLELTGDGYYLQTKIGTSLQFMCDAIESIGASSPPRGVVLSANTAMSQFWLGPTMRRYAPLAYGDSDDNIRLMTSDITSQLMGDEVDLALLYDVPAHDGWKMTPLFAEELFPVASPGYLDRNGRGLRDVEELRDHSLLDFERIEPNWVDWQRWLEGLGADTHWLAPNALYSHYAALIEAAEQGQGVALGTRYQIDSRLRERRLERLGEIGLCTGRHYWLGLNQRRAPNDAVVRLHDWLLGARDWRP